MSKLNLQDSFIEFCKKNKFEINNPQIEIIFYWINLLILKKIF